MQFLFPFGVTVEPVFWDVRKKVGTAQVAKLPPGRQVPCGAAGLMSDLCEQEINSYVLSH